MQFRFKTSKNKTRKVPLGSHSKTPAVDDSPVRVSKQSLIRLYRDSKALSLKSVKIRSQEGGHYLSPFKGRGMAFDEVRPYQAGDDVRTIDWRVTARTGKPHTKLYQEERERSVLFWVDYRAPMFFATRGSFKSVVAARAAALLAWSAVHHGDRLGGLVFSENQHKEIRPGRGKKGVLHFIQNLVEHGAWAGDTKETSAETTDRPLTHHDRENAANQALMRLRRVSRTGSLVFLMSDFRAINAQAESHLAQIARHNDVIMLFIHDPIEQKLPPAGLYRICDGQTNMTLDTSDKAGRRLHQNKFQERQAILKGYCRRYGIYFLPLATNDDLLSTLQKGLGLSQMRGRI